MKMLQIKTSNFGLLIVGAVFLLVAGTVWAEAEGEHQPAQSYEARLASLKQRGVRDAEGLRRKKDGAYEGNAKGMKVPCSSVDGDGASETIRYITWELI